MIPMWYPREYVDSVYNLDFKKYYEMGYRAVITDVDNTLVEHGAPSTPRAEQFFRDLREIGFRTCIISNNHEERVTPFANLVESPYVFDAGKPSRKGYQKALEICGVSAEQALFLGDQIFTDVWGANRSGIYSIMTQYIHRDTEFQIVMKRAAEAIVLAFYLPYAKRHGLYVTAKKSKH